MRCDRGLVLPMTLMAMLIVMTLTLGLLSLAGTEPAISRNLADGTQARYAAEAGIEWAYEQLVTTPDWNTMLAGADPLAGVTMVSGQSIGTLPVARGTYTVVLRNDNLPADPTITGFPADAAPDNDQNGTLIVTSAGALGSASKVVRVVMTRPVLPPIPGALNFPGNEAEATFGGDAFQISGHGWRTDGTLDPGCASQYGIAVSPTLPTSNPGGNEGVVESRLSSSQKDNVQGEKQNPSGSDQGNNTIAPHPSLTPANVKAFIDQAKAGADITLQSNQPAGLVFSNVGGSCAADPASPTCWGTPSTPKIVYVKGAPDPTSNFSALTLNGSSEGHGILIVENGDFRIYGDFKWHGPIIVTGDWVGIGFLGGGDQEVYGAVISNETATDPGYKEGVVTGNAKIRYSCEALDAAWRTRQLTTVANWKDLAPGE